MKKFGDDLSQILQAILDRFESDDKNIIRSAVVFYEYSAVAVPAVFEILPPETIIEKIPKDESAEMMSSYVEFISFIIRQNVLIPDDEIINLACELYLNEDEKLHEASNILISSLCYLKKDEINNFFWEFISSKIEENQEDEDVLAKCLFSYSEIIQFFGDELSNQCAQQLLDYAILIYEGNPASILIGPAVHALVPAVKLAGNLFEESAEKALNFGIELYQHDFEEDGNFIVGAIVDVFGKTNPQIVSILIEMEIELIKNIQDLSKLDEILETITKPIDYIEDPDQLAEIAETLISVLQEHIGLSSIRNIITILAKIYANNKDVIIPLISKIDGSSLFIPTSFADPMKAFWFITFLINQKLANGEEIEMLVNSLDIIFGEMVIYNKTKESAENILKIIDAYITLQIAKEGNDEAKVKIDEECAEALKKKFPQKLNLFEIEN